MSLHHICKRTTWSWVADVLVGERWSWWSLLTAVCYCGSTWQQSPSLCRLFQVWILTRFQVCHLLRELRRGREAKVQPSCIGPLQWWLSRQGTLRGVLAKRLPICLPIWRGANLNFHYATYGGSVFVRGSARVCVGEKIGWMGGLIEAMMMNIHNHTWHSFYWI